MEPKFIVDTTIDAACQLEASKGLASKFSKWMNYVMYAVILVLLGLTVWQYFTDRESFSVFTLVILVGGLAMLLYIHFRAPKTALRRWEERVRTNFGTDALHVHTEFYDLTLIQTMQENDSEIEEGYSAISAMKETQNLFLLRCNKTEWFFISKNGFTKGTPDEFRSFFKAQIGA